MLSFDRLSVSIEFRASNDKTPALALIYLYYSVGFSLALC